MEVLNVFVNALMQPLAVVLEEGRSAWSLNRKFWPCLVVGLFLPSIGAAIILSRRVRKTKIQRRLLKPVSSEEIFDPLLQPEEPKRINGDMIQFLARA